MVRRYKKRRNTKGKRKNIVTLSSHQARTKAYDSRIEKVMARVARQEDKKNQIRLEYRQYLFGAYSKDTNIYAASTFLHFTGFCVPLARIQKLDIATVGTNPPVAQPHQTPATWENPGANVLSPIDGRDGFRLGDWIKIHGISFSMRVWSKLLVNPLVQTYDHSYVYWKICAVVYDGSDVQDALPGPDQVLTLPRFGYSKRIDTNLALEALVYKVKTLAQGKIRMTLSNSRPDVKYVNRFVNLSKNPLKVEYDNMDQNGARILRWKPILCLRSNIPDNAAHIIYQPAVNVCTKLFYTDQ